MLRKPGPCRDEQLAQGEHTTIAFGRMLGRNHFNVSYEARGGGELQAPSALCHHESLNGAALRIQLGLLPHTRQTHLG
jgi:hypothetical protein